VPHSSSKLAKGKRCSLGGKGFSRIFKGLKKALKNRGNPATYLRGPPILRVNSHSLREILWLQQEGYGLSKWYNVNTASRMENKRA
jgi:hypothetical protein